MKSKTLLIILTLTFLNIHSQKKIKLNNGWYEIIKSESGILKIDRKSGDKYFLNSKPIVTPENFQSHEEFENYNGDKGISIKLNKKGAENWRIATKNSIGSKLVFILENEIFCTQIVNSEITAGVFAFWKTQQTENEWKKLKEVLN